MITLADILGLLGFDPKEETRLVRHQENLYAVQQQQWLNWLELYQSYQSRPRFHQIRQVVTFYGLPGNRAAFYGVFRVLGHRPATAGPLPAACPWVNEWQNNSSFFYELENDARFHELQHRLIINWGRGALAWYQRLTPKEVLEIREPGRYLPPFEDYLEFSLTFRQLQALFKSEEAHRDWRAPLSAVGGVYLVLAEGSGDLYVGSASGENGIWGRWREYAQFGQGNNAKLRQLIDSDASYPDKFRFSILQILPRSTLREALLDHEAQFKTKLGTRATGLNLN